MTEKEKKQWADFQKALKICKQDQLKDQLKDSYIKFLEGILERLDEKKDIMTEETVHVTQR
jgi:hypothetical protein